MVEIVVGLVVEWFEARRLKVLVLLSGLVLVPSRDLVPVSGLVRLVPLLVVLLLVA